MILEHITDKIPWYSSIGLIKCTYNGSFGGNKRLLLDLREISQIIYNLQRGSCGIISVTFSEALNGNSSVLKSLFSTESNNYMAELKPRPTVKAENIAYRQWSGLLWSTGFYVYCHHYQFFSAVLPLFLYHATFWAVFLVWFKSLNILEVLFIVLSNDVGYRCLYCYFRPPRENCYPSYRDDAYSKRTTKTKDTFLYGLRREIEAISQVFFQVIINFFV